MDILSSQANLAGYKAVIESFANFEKAIPMMMTAAGYSSSCKSFSCWCRCCWFTSNSNCKKNGCNCFCYRCENGLKRTSRKFRRKIFNCRRAENLETEGGYAKEASDDFKKKQEDLLRLKH